MPDPLIVCTVRAGGELLVCLSSRYGFGPPQAWRESMAGAPLELESLPAPGWYRVPEGTTRLVWPRPPKRVTVGWELPDGVDLGEGWPRRLTPAEWEDRSTADEDGDGESPELALYRRVVDEEEQPAEIHDLPEPLDVDAPPLEVPKGWTWRADLPFAVRELAQLRQFFPGNLDPGETLAEWAAKIHGVTVYGNQPTKAFVKIRNTTTGKVATKEVRLDRLLTGPIPAGSLAEAVAKIPQRQQEIEHALRARLATICSHCKGEGLEYPA